MALYTKPTLSGYNDNAPPDDGSNLSNNEVTWSKHKTKLGDPLKTYTDALNNAVSGLVNGDTADLWPATLSNLQDKSISGLADGDTVYMRGRSSVGDGGEGHFRWDSSDLSTEVGNDEVTSSQGNGGIYIAPASDKTGASGAWVRQRGRFVHPEWYGAGNDPLSAFQALVSHAQNTKERTLSLGQNDYRFATPLVISGDSTGGLVLEGPFGTHSEDGGRDSKGYLSVASGQSEVIELSGGESALGNIVGGHELRGFGVGTLDHNVTSGVKVSYPDFRSTLVFDRMHFEGFTDGAINIDQSNEEYIIGFVTVENCAFKNCTKSLLIQDANSIAGLKFDNNRCHQGGRIKGNINGPIRITNNNFEGQSDAVEITDVNNEFSYAKHVLFAGNYFENNSGDFLASFTADANKTESDITIRENTKHGSSFTLTDDVSYRVTGFHDGVFIDDTQAESVVDDCAKVNVPALKHVAADGTGQQIAVDINAIIPRMPPDSIFNTSQIEVNDNGDIVDTPFGPVKALSDWITDGSSYGGATSWPEFPYTAGELLVINILLAYKSRPSPAPELRLFDSAGTSIVNFFSLPRPQLIEDQHHLLITVSLTLSSNESEINALIFPNGSSGSSDGARVVGSYWYTTSGTRIYPYFPMKFETDGSESVSPDANGNADIAHGLSKTPETVQVGLRGDNTNGVDVESVDATNITVRVKDESGSDVTSGSFTVDWIAKL